MWDGAVLCCDATRLDLVFNRLTDFYLDSPASLVLRAAYLANAVIFAQKKGRSISLLKGHVTALLLM